MYGNVRSGGFGFATLFSVLTLIARWRLLTKAGEAGWKSLIPVYNAYLLYKIADAADIFWSLIITQTAGGILAAVLSGVPTAAGIVRFAVLIATLVLAWKYTHRLAAAFGKGTGFAWGLLLLFPVFTMILAFGSAVHISSCRMGSDAQPSPPTAG